MGRHPPGDFRVAVDGVLDLYSFDLVELAIGEGHELFVSESHGNAPSIVWSESRPRASRLVTVPTGTPTISAASL